MKVLFLCRGIPGAGKSTLGKLLGDVHFEADQYFTAPDGTYNWEASKTHLAHRECQEKTQKAMADGVARIAVSNTFTRESELGIYFELAAHYGYQVFSLVVENRHGGKNVHNVPEEALKAMKERFVVKL